jgi:hypothetical protein
MGQKEQTHKSHFSNFTHSGKGKGHPATGRGGPMGSGWIKAPDFLDFRHYKGGRLSAMRTGRLYTRRNPWYSLSEAESTVGGSHGKNPQ